MIQEEKDLLLKDLSARLHYGVKIALKNNGTYHHDNVAKKGDITIDILKGFTGSYFSIYHKNLLDWDWYDDDIDIEDIKPYLFHLSSMTAEQKIECFKGTPLEINKYGDIAVKDDLCGSSQYTDLEIYLEVIDWCNKNHFDYRGLISKGLAIDATGLNIY